MQGTKAAIKEGARELPHILVVDDEKSICELLEITFRKEGHRVEVANSTEAAKRKLESQIFDIIISDIRMPGEDGVDLLKFAKEIAPRGPGGQRKPQMEKGGRLPASGVAAANRARQHHRARP